MKARTGLQAIVLAYVVLLHLALVVTLCWPDAVWRRIHALWPPRGETISEFRRGMMATQGGIDATARPNAVWFFGDSIIHMLDTGRVTERALNLGIGEDTVSGVLLRIGDHPALPTAAGIVLAIGTNDLRFRSPEEAAQDYGSVLTRSPAEVPVIASAVLPVDERLPDLAGRNARIKRLNAAIARLCAARSRCTFVDAGPDMVDATGNLAPDLHVGDGLHLSRAGYRILIDTLIPPVRDRLPSRG